MEIESFAKALPPLLRNRPLMDFLMKTFSAPPFSLADPCPDISGMASVKKLKLLNLAVASLPKDGSECYLEVGTYRGKSLVAALAGNPDVPAVACDNFSEFEQEENPRNHLALVGNLRKYGLSDRVRFFNCHFRDLLLSWREKKLPAAGVYFYDGAHDENSQYQAVRLGEEILADSAVVIVDDWRQAADSHSFARKGTLRAVQESAHRWELLHELPARYNGDRAQWWNGVGLLSFRRKQATGRIHP